MNWSDKILTDWERITAVPGPTRQRRGGWRVAARLALGTAAIVLGAAVAVQLAGPWLALVGAARPTLVVGSAVGPSLAPPSPSAKLTSLSPVPGSVSPSESAGLPGPTATASADPSPVLAIGTPKPGDDEVARRLLQQFEEALVAHSWKSAWNLLSSEEQSREPFGQWAAAEQAFMRSAGTTYTVPEFTHDPDRIRFFIVPDDYPLDPVSVTTADLDRAYVAQVWYDALSNNNAGFVVYLLAPNATGEWRVWLLR
jgi:hypothetical protein